MKSLRKWLAKKLLRVVVALWPTPVRVADEENNPPAFPAICGYLQAERAALEDMLASNTQQLEANGCLV